MLSPLKKVGRVGLKALLYFEAMTTLALIIGLIVVNLWRPGVGMNVDAKTLDISGVQPYVTQARSMSAWNCIAQIIPNTVSASAEGEILQVLFFAILFAFSLQFMRERGEPVRQFIEAVTETFFGIVRLVMRAAPIGAFGAMAFTIGRYGVGTLIQLGQLMASVYTTCLLRPPSNPVLYLRRFFAQPRLRLAWTLAASRSSWWSMFYVYAPIFAVTAGLGLDLGSC
jgi:aerobic C4-dicarboxylate transport protein